MNFLKKAFSPIVLLLTLLVFVGFSTANAQTTPKPAFNWYDNVEGLGDEGDFLRIGKTAATGVNTKEVCEDGARVDFWFYVHNGAEPEFNGVNFDGPGVARNTRLNLSVAQNQFKNSHPIAASISADNASAVHDDATITCGSKKISLEYVGVTDFNTTAVTSPLGDFKLVGDPINGALVGYPGGVVPGCWEYRARLNFQVIVRVEKEQPKPPVYDCTNLVVAFLGERKDRKVRATTTTRVENGATVVKIDTNFGDGTTKPADANGVAEHSYKTDEDRTVVSTVTFRLPDNSTATKQCQTKVVFDKLPPVTKVTPTAMPKTGPADVIGLFSATTAGGALVHRYILSRRNRF